MILFKANVKQNIILSLNLNLERSVSIYLWYMYKCLSLNVTLALITKLWLCLSESFPGRIMTNLHVMSCRKVSHLLSPLPCVDLTILNVRRRTHSFRCRQWGTPGPLSSLKGRASESKQSSNSKRPISACETSAGRLPEGGAGKFALPVWQPERRGRERDRRTVGESSWLVRLSSGFDRDVLEEEKKRTRRKRRLREEVSYKRKQIKRM